MTTVKDEDGKTIKIGTRVRYIGDDKSAPAGKVVAISDPDDAGPDDEGRSMPVMPRVYVHWAEHNEPEDVSSDSGWSTYWAETSWTGSYYDDPVFICEELEAA